MDKLLQEITRYFETWLAHNKANSEAATETNILKILLEALQSSGSQQITPPQTYPVIERWLRSSLAMPTAAHSQALVNALDAVKDELHWVSLAEDYAGPEFSGSFAYTQIVGPDNVEEEPVIFPNNNIALGFSLQAPHLFYPPHYHTAIELYSVMTGTARWQHGHKSPVLQPPGTYIFHNVDAPHAMETSGETLLCLWAWVNDLDAEIHIPSREWLI